MSMVERMAKAIGCIDRDRCSFANSNSRKQNEKCGSCEECLACARTAIKAMREPTGGMITAGFEYAYDPDPAAVWRAMVDTALAEKSTAEMAK